MTTPAKDQKPPNDGFFPPSPDDRTDYSVTDAEPMVDVPAGLLGQAIELLDLCDELFNRPGHNLIDARVSAVIGRNQRASTETLRWFHDGLGATATGHTGTPRRQGITVDPTLPGPPAPHHR